MDRARGPGHEPRHRLAVRRGLAADSGQPRRGARPERWLAWINVAVAAFNLIPGFPLDGGRVFRALVWATTGDLRQATRVAAGVGRVLAFGFILFGVWQALGGNLIGGLWIAFIGWFLDNAAAQSARHADVQELLASHTVREIIMTDCPVLAPNEDLDTVVKDAVFPSGRRCFPVVEGDRLAGLLTLDAIKRIPAPRWSDTSVADLMIPLRDLETVTTQDPLDAVLERMTDDDVSQYPVVDDRHLVGMIARDRLLAFIRARAELGV